MTQHDQPLTPEKDILRKDEAWALLPPEERQKLYDMLPPPREGEPQHDIDVNPMQTMYRPYIEAEVRRWQDDLREGKETKAWRYQAIEAGREREKGVWDEWKEAQRELDWGVQDESGKQNEDEDKDKDGGDVEKDEKTNGKGDAEEVKTEHEEKVGEES